MEDNPQPADVQPPESSDDVQEKKPDDVTMASGSDAIATVVSSTGLDEEYEEPEEEESKEKAEIEKSEENEKGGFLK